jgi:hypothetical protein
MGQGTEPKVENKGGEKTEGSTDEQGERGTVGGLSLYGSFRKVPPQIIHMLIE